MICSVHLVQRANIDIVIVDGKLNKIENISSGLFLNQNQTHFRHKLKMFDSNNQQADASRI